MTGKLYLIPSGLGDSPTDYFIPGFVKEIINSIKNYIVENERTARRYLLKLGILIPIDELNFFLLNKHTDHSDLDSFLQPVYNGENIGLLSEAGLPGVADPGGEITLLAHKKQIRIIPLVGPSSIFLALMASGLNGQNFNFSGYLPVKRPERINRIRYIENRSGKENQTQIFMEAPYRNQALLNDIINTCRGETYLCIATDITLKTEFIKTQKISDWKDKIPEINKRPTIFLLQSF